ncbi:MAG: hypothetical protein JXA03_12430 [Bacteroidales bacterium]|nr:hypothetical protein [Bacteroidales bacterium]
MKKFILFSLAILPFFGMTQEEKKFGITFDGFVKTDVLWDSRQTVNIREGHFLLYPAAEMLDMEKKDINAASSFNMLSIQTRLKGNITGPDAMGAKTSGMIEGEFFGTSNGDVNGFRLRHAIIKLDWEKTQLMVGQFWHPLFNTNCFPGTVSFNTGAPFQPFTRNPQIRVTQKMGNFSMALTALTQRDFISNGPAGASSDYLRNAGVPAMNLMLQYKAKNEEKGNEFLISAAGNYKTLQPQLSTAKKYKTDAKASSFGVGANIKYACKNITVKLGEYFGQDSHDLTMLGGYAVKDVTDTLRGITEYTPISTQSLWAEIHSNGKKWQFGVFGGYTQNLGADDEIKGAVYSRGANIDYIYRVSPRVVFNAGKFRIAPEIEYTVAGYATKDETTGKVNIDEKGKVTEAEEVANIRFLIGAYFFF